MHKKHTDKSFSGCTSTFSNTLTAYSLYESARAALEAEHSALRKRLAGRVRATYSRAKKIGYAQGKARAQREFAAAILKAHDAYLKSSKNAVREALELASSLTTQFFESHRHLTDSFLTTQLTLALRRLGHDQKITIHLHPVHKKLARMFNGENISILFSDTEEPGCAHLAVAGGSLIVNLSDSLTEVLRILREEFQSTCSSSSDLYA